MSEPTVDLPLTLAELRDLQALVADQLIGYKERDGAGVNPNVSLARTEQLAQLLGEVRRIYNAREDERGALKRLAERRMLPP